MLEQFLQAAEALGARASALISAASGSADLEAARNQLLGRKSGELSGLMKKLPELSPEDRKASGATVNRVKTAIEEALIAKSGTLTAEISSTSCRDLTMPERTR